MGELNIQLKLSHDMEKHLMRYATPLNEIAAERKKPKNAFLSNEKASKTPIVETTKENQADPPLPTPPVLPEVRCPV